MLLKYVFLLFCLFSAATNAQTIRTYDQLVILIKDKKIKTIEELLPYLDSSLLSNYSLVYDTRSPQNSSLEKPRVILTNSDNSFTLAFGGVPDKLNGQVLEVVQKNNKTNALEFSKIDFAATPEKKFSHGDKSCIKCHGSKLKNGEIHMKYIWDSYPDWAGVYGSSHVRGNNKTGFGNSKNLIPDYEVHSFSDFQKTVKTSARHKYLLGIENISIEDLGTLNTRLTESFRKVNYDILSKFILEHKDLSKYIGHFADLSINDEKIFLNNLPKDILEELKVFEKENSHLISLELDKYAPDAVKRINKNLVTKSPDKTIVIDTYDLSQKSKIVKQAFLMDKFGIPIESFSQTLQSSGMDFFGPGTAIGDREILGNIIEAGLAKKYPEITSDSTYDVDGIRFDLKTQRKIDSKMVKVLLKEPNKKELNFISAQLEKLKGSKSSEAYIKHLIRIIDKYPEHVNVLLKNSFDTLIKLAPSIKQLKSIEKSYLISTSNKMILKDQALKNASNIGDFLAAVLHTTHHSEDYIEGSDLLLSKYFDKFLSLNPTANDFLKLESKNFVRPHIASEIYDQLSKNFKNTEDFIDYFTQREKLKTSKLPRRRFLFSNVLKNNLNKYQDSLSLDQLKRLVNSNLFYDDIHAELASKALKLIKTKEEFKQFKFRKDSSPKFEEEYKSFIKKNPRYTFISSLNCVFNQLIGK